MPGGVLVVGAHESLPPGGVFAPAAGPLPIYSEGQVPLGGVSPLLGWYSCCCDGSEPTLCHFVLLTALPGGRIGAMLRIDRRRAAALLDRLGAPLGYGLLAVGGALLILPGPGLPFLLGGLALLAPRRAWARRARLRLRQGLARIRLRGRRPARAATGRSLLSCAAQSAPPEWDGKRGIGGLTDPHDQGDLRCSCCPRDGLRDDGA